MDPLSDLLLLLKPRRYLSGKLEAGGRWAFRFPNEENAIMCFSIVRGSCWLILDELSDKVRLAEGDCLVLPSGRAFGLTSEPDIPQEEYESRLSYSLPGGVVTVNGGGDFLLAGTRFAVDRRHVDLLRGILPAVVHLRQESEQAALRWSVDRMMEEMQNEQPGSPLLTQQLAHMILVLTMRRHIAEGASGDSGWFAALADKHVGLAIKAMHADLKFRWTLDNIARRATMSRSKFAARFKTVMGETPMEYLTRWRILVAAEKLKNTSDPIAKVAAEVGYQSESAFSNAFKRLMGSSPRRYVRHRQSESQKVGDTGNGIGSGAIPMVPKDPNSVEVQW